MEKTGQPFPWWAFVFAGGGALLLFTGQDSDTLLVGAMSVLIFGGFCVLGAILRWRPRSTVQVVDGGFFLGFSAVRQTLGPVAFAGMTVGSVLLALSGETFWGSVCAVVFAWLTIHMARTA